MLVISVFVGWIVANRPRFHSEEGRREREAEEGLNESSREAMQRHPVATIVTVVVYFIVLFGGALAFFYFFLAG